MFCRIAARGGNLSCHVFNVLEDLEIFLQDNINSGLNIDEITAIFYCLLMIW